MVLGVMGLVFNQCFTKLMNFLDLQRLWFKGMEFGVVKNKAGFLFWGPALSVCLWDIVYTIY